MTLLAAVPGVDCFSLLSLTLGGLCCWLISSVRKYCGFGVAHPDFNHCAVERAAFQKQHTGATGGGTPRKIARTVFALLLWWSHCSQVAFVVALQSFRKCVGFGPKSVGIGANRHRTNTTSGSVGVSRSVGAIHKQQAMWTAIN